MALSLLLQRRCPKCKNPSIGSYLTREDHADLHVYIPDVTEENVTGVRYQHRDAAPCDLTLAEAGAVKVPPGMDESELEWFERLDSRPDMIGGDPVVPAAVIDAARRLVAEVRILRARLASAG